MGTQTRVWLSSVILAASLIAWSTCFAALTFNVVLDTTSLEGMDATLAFDFFDGGPPSNTVVLSTLVSNGTQGTTSTVGDVTGSNPWTFSDLGNTSFFNELLVDFTPMGTSLSFSFTVTDNPADPSDPFSSPDSFQFTILDSTSLMPLIASDEPLGTDALFLISLGQGDQGLNVYNPILGPDQIFSIEVTPASAPEPATLALLVVGFGAMFRRRRLV